MNTPEQSNLPVAPGRYRKWQILALSVVCVGLLVWMLNRGHVRLAPGPQPAGSGPSAARSLPDDVAGEAVALPAKNGLIRSLQEQIEANPALESADSADPLLDMLAEADDLLSVAKLRNREALRQASRQVRVGAARLSPHFVVVLADRIAPGDLGCFGNETSVTPNIDELAAGGMRFTSFYAGGPDPEVGFWSLMTGRSGSRAPQESSSRLQLQQSDQTLAEVLWQAGYNTMFLGVWPGPDRPLEHGFDDWVGRFPTNPRADAFPEVLLAGRAQMRVLENADGQRQVTLTKLLAAEAEAYIERNARSERPYLLLVRLPSAAVCEESAGPTSPPAAALAAWDEFVGRLSFQAKELNLQRRLCVIFAGLSGRAASDAAGPLDESSLRTPLVINWTGGTAANVISDHVCTGYDLLPTLVELAKVSPRPGDMDGVSLHPSMRRLAQPEHPLILWRFGNVQAVRKGKWKGVYVAGEQTIRLYDLEQDPGETRDLAAEHPEVVKQLIAPRRTAANTRS